MLNCYAEWGLALYVKGAWALGHFFSVIERVVPTSEELATGFLVVGGVVGVSAERV